MSTCIVFSNIEECDHDGLDHGDDYEEVDSYTNHDMVEKAFQECDLNHEGRWDSKLMKTREQEILEKIYWNNDKLELSSWK